MYEMWLSLTNQNRRADGTLMTPPPEEKQIAMPTDYSESMVGVCRNKWFVCVIRPVVFEPHLSILYFHRLGDGCLVAEGICDLGPKVCGYRRSGWVFLFRCQLLKAPFPTLSVPLWEVPGFDALQGRAPDCRTNSNCCHIHTPHMLFHPLSNTFAHSLTGHFMWCHVSAHWYFHS